MKRLRTAAIFLPAGAVVSLLVAVLGAAFEKPDQLNIDPTTRMKKVWSRYAPANWPEANYGFVAEGKTWDYQEAIFSGNMPGADQRVPRRAVNLVLTRWRAGWPLRSLVGIKVGCMAGGGLASTHTLWLLDDLTIPYGPIWHAVVLNAVLYATIFWSAIRGPTVIRGLIRMKRGQCVKCGYPTGESPVCTECGTAIGVRRVGRSCSSTAPARGR